MKYMFKLQSVIHVQMMKIRKKRNRNPAEDNILIYLSLYMQAISTWICRVCLEYILILDNYGSVPL